jgi:hypothetical protein
MESSAAVRLTRPDLDTLELAQLVLINIADRDGRVVLQSIWVVDARGRRVTQSEDIVSKDELIDRLNELIPKLRQP